MTPLDVEQMDLLEHFKEDGWFLSVKDSNHDAVEKFVEGIYLSLAQAKQINVAFDKKDIKKSWPLESLLNRAFISFRIRDAQL